MKLGYFGLGIMGGALARRLAKSGPIEVFDLSPAALAEAEKAGATPAESAATLAKGCDVVFLCLPRSENVEQVLFGAGGIADHLHAGAYVIDQTSGDPETTRIMAAKLAERGIHMLDAPVSGGAAGAEAGTIAIMLGGDEADRQSIRPILERISPNIFDCGDIGSGQVMKLINNMVSSTIRMVTLEGAAMGVRNGLDLQTITDVLNSGGAHSRATSALLPALVRGEPDSRFQLSLMLKDLNLAARLAIGSGCPAHYGQLTRSMLQTASTAYGDQADYFDITRLVADQAGISFAKAEPPSA
jgi:3-hydroxyisobutyrate dehydrogenase